MSCLVLFAVKYYFVGPTLYYLLLNGIMTTPAVLKHVVQPVKLKTRSTVESLWEKYSSKLCIGGNEDTSSDDLAEFIPDSDSEEVEAALQVPFTKTDRYGNTLPRRKVDLNKRLVDETESLPVPEPEVQPESSPFNSLTPNIAAASELPSVSDSSDDEDEFLEGLIFDKTGKSNLDSTNAPALTHNSAPIVANSQPSVNNQENSSIQENLAFLASHLLTQNPSVRQNFTELLTQSVAAGALSSFASNFSMTATAGAPSDETDQNLTTDSEDDLDGTPTPPISATSSIRERLPIAEEEHQDDFEFISDDEMSD